jgi:hypothetical protein
LVYRGGTDVLVLYNKVVCPAIYLVRYKHQSADKDEWLPESNIPDGAIHLRNYRASKRN